MTGAHEMISVPGMFGAATEYATDAAQRWVLFLDVLRQRGNAYREHAAETAPKVLEFKCELLIDGRKLDRPVNYALVRIVPPLGVEIHQTARRFIGDDVEMVGFAPDHDAERELRYLK